MGYDSFDVVERIIMKYTVLSIRTEQTWLNFSLSEHEVLEMFSVIDYNDEEPGMDRSAIHTGMKEKCQR